MATPMMHYPYLRQSDGLQIITTALQVALLFIPLIWESSIIAYAIAYFSCAVYSLDSFNYLGSKQLLQRLRFHPRTSLFTKWAQFAAISAVVAAGIAGIVVLCSTNGHFNQPQPAASWCFYMSIALTVLLFMRIIVHMILYWSEFDDSPQNPVFQWTTAKSASAYQLEMDLLGVRNAHDKQRH